MVQGKICTSRWQGGLEMIISVRQCRRLYVYYLLTENCLLKCCHFSVLLRQGNDRCAERVLGGLDTIHVCVLSNSKQTNVLTIMYWNVRSRFSINTNKLRNSKKGLTCKILLVSICWQEVVSIQPSIFICWKLIMVTFLVSNTAFSFHKKSKIFGVIYKWTAACEIV